MPKQQLRIGVIGGGMIGDVHLTRLRRDGRARVTWLAEPSAATLQSRIEQHQIAHGTADYRQVLADPDVDAVVIATPPSCHVSMAIDALRAGKHVLLEKPMARNRAELRRLLREAEKHPKQVLLDCSCRHARLQPKYRYIKAIIDSGEIGEVYHVHHQHLLRTTFLDWNPRGLWARSKAQAGGGPVMDWGVYDLSFHLGVLGDDPDHPRVHGFARGGLKVVRDRKLRSDVEEHAAAWLEFDNGVTYYTERAAGAHLEATNETRICGTRGGLRFSFPSWESRAVEVFLVDRRGREKKEIRTVPYAKHADDNLELTRHFLDCVLEGKKPMMPAKLAGKHLEILFKILATGESPA